jgi:hypothetical protein
VTNKGENFIFLSDYEAPNFRLISVFLNMSIPGSEIPTYPMVLVPEDEKNILKWVEAFDG